MKPIELYQQWSQFEMMMANPSLSDESKLKMGAEWLRALPPKQLCVSSTLSYEVVEEAIKGRLNDLKEKINGRTATTKKEEKGQEPAQSKDGSRKKSVRKDATD